MNCEVRKRRVKSTLILLHSKSLSVWDMVKAYQCGIWFHDRVGILMVQIIVVCHLRWLLNVVVKLIFSYGSCLIFLLECLSLFLAIS